MNKVITFFPIFCFALLTVHAQTMTDFRFPAQAMGRKDVTFENGLPVIQIDTENGTEITSKEDYLNMTFVLTDPDHPENNVLKTDMTDLIRGRGHDSWTNPNAKKKSYRIKFDKKTSLFGLEAAKSWVLIAQYRDATLLYNVTAFELGNRFAFPFNHSFHFVDLYLNGEYRGNYLLTEQNQVNPGRVAIDEKEGWLVEMDGYYDEEPKFRTTNYRLPVIIKSPESEWADINDPAFDFVRTELNALTNAVASSRFPENGYRDLIDMQTFIDFLMINEICDNKEIETPMSTFMYKDKGGLINMGPLWDFDCGYGYGYNYVHYGSPDTRTPLNDFFKKLFDDPVFLVKYKERWNEKYDDIISMPDFMDATADKIEQSAIQNFQTWWYRTNAPWTNTHAVEPNDFWASVSNLKNWYNAHTSYLHSELNKVEVLPASKDFGTASNISNVSPQTFTLVAYGDITELRADFENGSLLAFEITAGSNQIEATGKGGYMAFVSVKPKTSLSVDTYNDVLILSGKNQGSTFSLKVPLSFTATESITGIDEMPPPNPLKAWVRNEQLHVSGMIPGEMLSIYNATGALVYRSIAASDETDIPLKVQGVYIVQSGKNTIKVVFE